PSTAFFDRSEPPDHHDHRPSSRGNGSRRTGQAPACSKTHRLHFAPVALPAEMTCHLLRKRLTWGPTHCIYRQRVELARRPLFTQSDQQWTCLVVVPSGISTGTRQRSSPELPCAARYGSPCRH